MSGCQHSLEFKLQLDERHAMTRCVYCLKYFSVEETEADRARYNRQRVARMVSQSRRERSKVVPKAKWAIR